MTRIYSVWRSRAVMMVMYDGGLVQCGVWEIVGPKRGGGKVVVER